MYLEPSSFRHMSTANTRGALCASCGARSRSICANLPDMVVDELFHMGRTQVLHRGETLQWESDEAVVVGNLREGLLKLTASLDDGREQILGIAFPGDFIGRPFAARAGHCITALTEARLCIFRRKAFDTFAASHPEVEHALLLRAFDELERARRWMLLLGRKTAGERVASLLIELADRLEREPGERVELALTRQQMADLLGLTIETVSRKLTILKTSGVIRLPDVRSFEIEDREGLELLAGG